MRWTVFGHGWPNASAQGWLERVQRTEHPPLAPSEVENTNRLSKHLAKKFCIASHDRASDCSLNLMPGIIVPSASGFVKLCTVLP